MLKKWTEREESILRSFWKTGEPCTGALSLLPGRTEAAIRMQARRLGVAMRKPGPKPQLEKAVLDHLKKQGPLSTYELGAMLLCDRRQADYYIRLLRAKKKVYSPSFIETRGGKLSRRWAIGNLPDAPYPPKGQREGIPVAIVANRAVEKKALQIDSLMAAFYGRAA